MNKRVLLITGTPGIGKTTVLSKAAENLKAKGYVVGGMISREARSGGNRIGFQIMDLQTSGQGWLARTNTVAGPRVGKYRVNMKDLDDIGAQAIFNSIKNADIVVIDEIGPMELFSKKFEEAVRTAVEGPKLVIAVVHFRARSQLIDSIKNREDAETYVATLENRQNLHQKIVENAVSFLSRTVRR